MILVSQIKLDVNTASSEDEVIKALTKKACKILGCNNTNIKSLEIVKRSIDARKKPDIYFVYSVVAAVDREDIVLKQGKSNNVSKYIPKEYNVPSCKKSPKLRPVVVGFGPAGIAAAYTLAKAGLAPIVIERGARVEDRQSAVSMFWKSGKLNPDTNVQFGEGGAGAFSDGKLNTGNKDKDGLKAAVLRAMVAHGAPKSIVYDAKPHIGTDILCDVVRSFREDIISMGGEFFFETRFLEASFDENKLASIIVSQNGNEKEIQTDTLILAIGHSSRDTFTSLQKMGISIEPKAFAVGYRVAHLQSVINNAQYGLGWEEKKLPAADYKLTYTAHSGRPVYSFCMCPGGFIVNASSENEGLCINGMSYSKRDRKYANSAIVMGITPDELAGEDPLRGMYFQQEIEKRAYEVGQGNIPMCLLGDSKIDIESKAVFCGNTSLVSNMISNNLILSKELNSDFLEAMSYFSSKISGFDNTDTIVSGIESRTSSPIRILRDKDYQAISHKGIYPCGEGAGYAGGIMSAAMDGARTATHIIEGRR